MRTIHLSIDVRIDDNERVTFDKISYHVTGKHDAPICDTELDPLKIKTESGPTMTEPNVSRPGSQELLALLVGLGLNIDESTHFITSRTADRIKEVARWIRQKKNVTHPAGLARKLLELK